MQKHIIGVDVGGTTVKFGLFEENGSLKEKWNIKTDVCEEQNGILQDISNSINEKLNQFNLEKKNIIGVGIGVPGPVLQDGTVNRCVNLNWGRFNIEQALSEIMGLTVKAGNDANVAALGEQWKGGGEGRDNIVVVTLGTGVGGGVIIGGKIHNGFCGSAGEIGHINVYDDETDICGCGKKGCLEQYVSANGIIRLANRYLRLHDTNTQLGENLPINSVNIFKAAQNGDIAAEHIVQEMFKLLGKTLAQVSAVLDPQAYVIGGGVSNEGEYLTQGVKKAFDKYVFHASKNTEILLAKLGNDAGIYGAARMVLAKS